jgi:hypothetical protein
VTPVGTPLYCDEHGWVATGGITSKPAGVEVVWTWFCPHCQRELFPRDPLTDIERQEQQAATFDEWRERQDIPVLDMGTVELGESEGAGEPSP